MKKLAFLVAVSAILVACNDKDEATNVPDTAPVEQNSTSNSTNQANTTFNFTEFDLDIDYSNNKSYEVSYDNDVNGAEAKIEDEVNNSVIQGNEAIDKLIPIFESFTFDATTDSNAVIDEVLQKFGPPDNYQSVDIDITFADGTKKEYRRNK